MTNTVPDNEETPANPEEILAKYQQAHNAQPNDVETLLNWGTALILIDRLDEAIAKFQQGLQLAPDHAELFHNWGIALARLGKEEDAQEKFEKANELRDS